MTRIHAALAGAGILELIAFPTPPTRPLTISLVAITVINLRLATR